MLSFFQEKRLVIVMKKSYCELLTQYFPSISEVQDLHSTYIINCVFNDFFTYTAIIINIMTIHAIRKTSCLPKTLRPLLLSLAVSDVGVGLLVQPFYTSLLVKWLEINTPSCNTLKVFLYTTKFFSAASFLGVVAVSVDRFLAVHLHLRYQKLVTHKRVTTVVISVWLYSAFYSLMALWVPSDIRNIFRIIKGGVCVLVTTLVYIRIYLAVRRHKNLIQAQQLRLEAQTGDMTQYTSVIKSAVGIFYVHIVFWVCYLPFYIYIACITINGPSIALKRFYPFTLTLIFLNSSLNPVIYCWKMRHIRHAIMDILRNISWNRN